MVVDHENRYTPTNIWLYVRPTQQEQRVSRPSTASCVFVSSSLLLMRGEFKGVSPWGDLRREAWGGGGRNMGPRCLKSYIYVLPYVDAKTWGSPQLAPESRDADREPWVLASADGSSHERSSLPRYCVHGYVCSVHAYLHMYRS